MPFVRLTRSWRILRSCSQPQRAEDVTVEAWYMDDSDEDQRLPHK